MVTLRLPTYTRREAPLRGRGYRVLSLFTSGVHREFRRPVNLVALILAVAFGVIGTMLTIFLASLIPGQALDATAFYAIFTNPAVLLLILVVATAVGSGLVAEDLRHMSLALYLSRPLTVGDYLTAKAGIVALAVFVAVAFPGILGPIVAALLTYVTWEVALHALAAGLGLGLLATALFASVVLLFSSLTRRKGAAAAGAFATVLATQILAQPLRFVFEAEEVLHLSLYENLLAVGRVLYGVEGGPLAWPLALLVLLAVILASAALTYLRLRSLEVVAG